jgi:ankyrin repeat protein
MESQREPDSAGRLIAACFEGEVELARRLLAEEPGLWRARDSELESTPLHVSAHRGYTAIVEALLAAGADVDVREGCSNTTALHWAAEAGQVAVAERLLDAGADLHARDAWHELTPHDWAVVVVHAPHRHADRKGLAELLERRGAEPSIFASIVREDREAVRRAVAREPGALEQRLGPVDGEATPLVFAVERRATAMVELLLALGASPEVARASGLSALALARMLRDDASEERLLAAGARRDLSFLLVSGDLDAARALVRSDPSIVRSGGRSEALLHAAALHGLVDATQLLLEAGADPNAKHACLGVDEWLAEVPPLFLAAGKGCTSVARRLLDHGARVDETAMRSQLTPLHVAAFRGWRPLVELLLQSGASPGVRDARHSGTPADWARHAGRAELAELIDAADSGAAQR